MPTVAELHAGKHHSCNDICNRGRHLLSGGGDGRGMTINPIEATTGKRRTHHLQGGGNGLLERKKGPECEPSRSCTNMEKATRWSMNTMGI